MTAHPGAARNSTLRLLSIVGARPQFIKLAPLCYAITSYSRQGCAERQAIEHIIVHTGQHYDPEMAGSFFEELNIPYPNYDLKVGSGPQHAQIAAMIERIQPILLSESPDWVIIYGDTNSTLAGALVAARMHIAVAHVEAGCRSFNMLMPEEQNRLVADHLSTLLFTATESARRNLLIEGIGTDSDPRKRRVLNVGDLMFDVLLSHSENAELPAELQLGARDYYLLTLHRAENTDDRQKVINILTALNSLGTPILFPIHPRTRHLLSAGSLPDMKNVVLSPPLGYVEMLAAEKHARAILTDSGGVQKEAFCLETPCFTLRNETEWPETLIAGNNVLVGTEPARILSAVGSLKDRTVNRNGSQRPFGDGNAAGRILDAFIGTQKTLPTQLLQ